MGFLFYSCIHTYTHTYTHQAAFLVGISILFKPRLILTLLSSHFEAIVAYEFHCLEITVTQLCTLFICIKANKTWTLLSFAAGPLSMNTLAITLFVSWFQEHHNFHICLSQILKSTTFAMTYCLFFLFGSSKMNTVNYRQVSQANGL